MKKTYSKPEILFEDFSLSTSITAGCEYPGVHAQGTCGYDVSGKGRFTFTGTITACTYKAEDDGANGVCYHVPSEYNDIFNS